MCIVGIVIDAMPFYTRIGLLQLATEFLSMPNDWLRREFKVLFSCPPSKLFHTLAILNQVHCRGLPSTSRIAVREIACVWPMLDSISHTMRVAGWGLAPGVGNIPSARGTFIRSYLARGVRRRSMRQPRMIFEFQARSGANLTLFFHCPSSLEPSFTATSRWLSRRSRRQLLPSLSSFL